MCTTREDAAFAADFLVISFEKEDQATIPIFFQVSADLAWLDITAQGGEAAFICREK